MAVKNASVGAEETSEREYTETINAAVKSTEQEVFADALGDDELENDGDTSLEEMGDGLEGETEDGDTEEADDGEEGEAEAAGEDGEEAEAAESEEDAGDETGQQPQGDARGRQPAIPPGRLRQEAELRRATEERNQALERELANMRGRLDEVSARVNAPPQRAAAEPPPKPDMFADPAAYEQWVLNEATRQADARIEQRFGAFQQQQQAQREQFVNQSLNLAARGERGFEFTAAYNALTSLDPKNPQNQALGMGIFQAPDPAKALFDWWDANGGQDYRDQVAARMGFQPQQQRQRSQGREQGQQRQAIRHEIRPGRTLPSLNGATGSNVHRTADPEMQDGSERSVFDYGSRR